MAAAVFFDTETTGLPQFSAGAGSPLQPHIVQLGAILQDLDTRKVMMELNLILKIPDDVEIHPKALEVHKISKEMTEKYGVYPATALKLFDVMLGRAEVVVAHNLSFDSLIYEAAVLRDQFLSMENFRKCRASCTMKNSTMICKIPHPKKPGSFKWPTLQEASAFFYPEVKWDEAGAHDAMYDVRKCQDIYWGILKHMGQA